MNLHNVSSSAKGGLRKIKDAEQPCLHPEHNPPMHIYLTAIAYKGIEQVENEIENLAAKCLCTKSYIKNIIKKVKNNHIEINSGEKNGKNPIR